MLKKIFWVSFAIAIIAGQQSADAFKLWSDMGLIRGVRNHMITNWYVDGLRVGERSFYDGLAEFRFEYTNANATGDGKGTLYVIVPNTKLGLLNQNVKATGVKLDQNNTKFPVYYGTSWETMAIDTRGINAWQFKTFTYSVGASNEPPNPGHLETVSTLSCSNGKFWVATGEKTPDGDSRTKAACANGVCQ